MFYLWLIPLALVGAICIWALYLSISRGRPEESARPEESEAPAEHRQADATAQGGE